MYVLDLMARQHEQDVWEDLNAMIETIDQQQMKRIPDHDFRKNLVTAFENVLELLGYLHGRFNKIEDFIQQNLK